MNEAAALARTLERAVTYRGNKGPTALPAGVRIAVRTDAAAVMRMLEMEALENALVPVDWDKVRERVEIGLRRDGNIIGLIDAPDRQGELAATVGLNMGHQWYSSAWDCEEIWNFVHPDYRKASFNYANMLIQFSQWWAEQLEVPLFMSVVSNVRTIGKVRLYARRIPFVGGVFLHNCPVAETGADG